MTVAQLLNILRDAPQDAPVQLVTDASFEIQDLVQVNTNEDNVVLSTFADTYEDDLEEDYF